MPRPEKPVDPSTGKPITFDHLRSKKKPARRHVDIVLDADKFAAFSELDGRLDLADARVEATPATSSEYTGLKAEAESLRKQAEKLIGKLRDDGDVVRFTFRSIGSHAYDELVNTHQPTEQQIADARKRGHDRPAWNYDTFVPALVAASLESPELTLDEVIELYKSDDWNAAELSMLSTTALVVNQSAQRADLGKD